MNELLSAGPLELGILAYSSLRGYEGFFYHEGIVIDRLSNKEMSAVALILFIVGSSILNNCMNEVVIGVRDLSSFAVGALGISIASKGISTARNYLKAKK